MNFRNIATAMLLIAVASLTSSAGEFAEAGRKLAADQAASVIRVSITSKINDREFTREVVATIIDSSGLAVTSLTTVDPASSLAANVRSKVKSEVVAMKYILVDGTEVEGKVVLKDGDLDIAFLAPKEKLTDDQAKLTKALDLGKAKGKELKMMDDYLALTRLSKDFRRVPSVRAARVSAVITKPRTMYYPGADLGSPVFNTAGDLVGFSVVKRIGRKGVSVIRPIADIKELVPQAKQALATKE